MEGDALIEFLDSPRFVKAASNSTRLVAKLKTAAQKHELYETHQILRTIYYRFINSNEKVNALLELLYKGSKYLMRYQEYVSGQDIALLLLEASVKCLQIEQGDEDQKNRLETPSLAYHIRNKTLDLDICYKVSTIATDLPDTDIGQMKFVSEVLRVLHPKILNRDLLHNVMAIEYWKHKDYVNTRYHFLRCANPENAEDIAKLLVEYHCRSATKSEVDLFITQFIFQLLCLQCPSDPPRTSNQKQTNLSLSGVSQKSRKTIRFIAQKIFSTYTLQHPQLSQVCIPFSSLPLLNFTYFIISTLDSDQDATAFDILCDVYKTTWNRDPNYRGYLNRIGTVYYGIVDQVKQQQGGGFFNNILMSLLDGADDDDGDSNHDGNNLSSWEEVD